MKVDKELLEKYHRQACTPEERRVVEDWLLDEMSDEQLEIPVDAQLEQEMWQEIATTLPSPKPVKYLIMKLAAAAAILFAVIFAGVQLLHQHENLLPVAVNNQSVEIKYIRSSDYNMSVGPRSTALVNQQMGTMSFTGSLILEPKADMQLSVDNGRQTLKFKAGQTYILVNDGEVLVVNERNLMDMPPVLQQRISAEFKI